MDTPTTLRPIAQARLAGRLARTATALASLRMAVWPNLDDLAKHLGRDALGLWLMENGLESPSSDAVAAYATAIQQDEKDVRAMLGAMLSGNTQSPEPAELVDGFQWKMSGQPIDALIRKAKRTTVALTKLEREWKALRSLILAGGRHG